MAMLTCEITSTSAPSPSSSSSEVIVIGSFAPELKLELLEETSERVRLKRLCEILETVATAVQRQRETAEVASRNGHVHPHRS